MTKVMEEEKAIEALEASVEAALSKGEQPSPQAILCLASYKALMSIMVYLLTDSMKSIRYLLRQVMEPSSKVTLSLTCPCLEEITDEVSVKVRAQYEEIRIPRWVNLGYL